jgi:cell division protein FtsB
MLEFQRKRKTYKILYSYFSIVVLLLVIFFLSKAVFGLYGKAQASIDARKKSEHEYKELSARYDYVKGEIGRLRTQEGIEEEVREKFSVVKPGEKLIVLVAGASIPAVEEEKGFFKKIFDKTKSFFHN